MKMKRRPGNQGNNIREKLKQIVREQNLNHRNSVNIRMLQQELIREVQQQIQQLEKMKRHFENAFTVILRALEIRLQKFNETIDDE